MRSAPTPLESGLLAACALLALLALFGPAVAQPAHLHDFADRRTLAGIPCAFDVLSNLAFAVAGGWGWRLLARLPAQALGWVARACAHLFCAGLVATALGSAWYHLAPDDAGLVVDRLAMGLAFAGLLGLLAATRVSERAGLALAGALLVLAPAAVLAGFVTGNVLPWLAVQFGGLLLVLVLPWLAPGGTLPVRWGAVVAAYALAKLFELGDAAVFAATGEWLSGHTLKHVVAAIAAVPVLAGLAAAGHRQNAPHAARRPVRPRAA